MGNDGISVLEGIQWGLWLTLYFDKSENNFEVLGNHCRK